MQKYIKTASLFISLSIVCLIFSGCGDKQDNSPQALETKKVVEFGLAADGRISPYDYGARFLVEITNLVANPQKLTD